MEDTAKTIEDQVTTETNLRVSSKVTAIQSALKGETDTIAMYEDLLAYNDLTDTEKAIIKEINDDEKDHMVMLTTMLSDIAEDSYPENFDNAKSEIADINSEDDISTTDNTDPEVTNNTDEEPELDF